jgi:hypothetical protein
LALNKVSTSWRVVSRMVNVYEAKDYETLFRWYRLHALPVPPQDLLPKFGLIDPQVAAGFLITTDSGLGIIDFYISNPESKTKERDQVLSLITDGLLSHGRKIGLKYFQCTSQIPSVKNRAVRHGFQYLGEYSFFYRGDN